MSQVRDDGLAQRRGERDYCNESQLEKTNAKIDKLVMAQTAGVCVEPVQLREEHAHAGGGSGEVGRRGKQDWRAVVGASLYVVDGP